MTKYKIINKKKLVATAFADAIGSLFFSMPRLFRKNAGKIRPEEVSKILVVRTAYIGDVIMTLPILKPLKDLYPGAHITFLTSAGAGEVLKSNPYVDEVLTFNPFWFYPSTTDQYRHFIRQMRKRRFDLVIETRADIRDILFLAWPLKARFRLSYGVGGGAYLLTHQVSYPGLRHKVEYHLDLVRYLGYDGSEREWSIYLTEEERQRVRAIMTRNGVGQPFIAVHPGSRLSLKRWAASRYGALCDRLAEQYGMPVVVFGSAEEKTIIDAMIMSMQKKPISLAGAVGLREMAGIVSQASVFICNDSAPMHIAAAMKTPTVAIFGPSKSIETGPFGDGHRVVEKEFPCRYRCDENSCSHPRHNACMDAIEVDDVFRAVSEILARSAKIDVQT